MCALCVFGEKTTVETRGRSDGTHRVVLNVHTGCGETVPTCECRDIWPPVLTSLLHPIVFDLPTFVLDLWKHSALVGRLVGGSG